MDAALYSRWRAARDLLRQHQEEVLPATLEYAQTLGVDRVIIFGFDRAGAAPGRPPDEALAALHAAAEQAQRSGARLCLEAEAGFWGDTGQRTMALVEAVGHPALGINWDPGNALVAGDTPYPDGYAAVRGRVWHVHFKDAARGADGNYRYAVSGDVDWVGQIDSLRADGYAGYISIETHMAPRVANALASLRRLQTLIEKSSGIPNR
jgi:sugar phosphate isomerase/epimerase